MWKNIFCSSPFKWYSFQRHCQQENCENKWTQCAHRVRHEKSGKLDNQSQRVSFLRQIPEKSTLFVPVSFYLAASKKLFTQLSKSDKIKQKIYNGKLAWNWECEWTKLYFVSNIFTPFSYSWLHRITSWCPLSNFWLVFFIVN